MWRSIERYISVSNPRWRHPYLIIAPQTSLLNDTPSFKIKLLSPKIPKLKKSKRSQVRMMTESGKVNSKSGGYYSLPVPNVQELAKNKLKEVPDRYIRPELETHQVSIDESLEVPVINLQKLLDQQLLGTSDDEMGRLHKACGDWGFFQLINHGVPEEIIDSMKSDTVEFFKLPFEEKKAYAQEQGNIDGYGQIFVVSEDQKLEWADMLSLLTLPVSDRIMKFWPTKPSSFRETLDKYAKEMEKLTICLLGLFEKNLGIESEKLRNIYERGIQTVRLNYYPPCPDADKVIGISPHSDASIITLLVQVNGVEGLQIKKDGYWVPIRAIPGAFIVNIGDVLEIVSNGIYKSIEHKVIIQPEKERLSIVGFQEPEGAEVIGPFPELLGESGANYKTQVHHAYLKRYFSSQLDGKKVLDLMKL